MRIGCRIHTILLLALLLTGRADAVIFKWYSVPDLVGEAAVIARGTIAVEKGEPFLVVADLLKGDAPDRIMLGSRGIGVNSPAEFKHGEGVVVFLNAPDETGRYYLVGYSNQGKWPEFWKNHTYGRAGIDELAHTIRMVEEALAGPEFEQQGSVIKAMLTSNSETLQMAGLDMALSETLSNSLTQYERAPALRQLAAFALPLLKSLNTDVRDTAIRLTENAPNTVAAAALIPLITDPELRCRQHAKVALGRVVADCKIEDPDIESWYKRRLSRDPDAPENRDAEEMKAKFEAAWAFKREDRLAKDVSRLQASLASASSSERTSAMLYLQYLGLSE